LLALAMSGVVRHLFAKLLHSRGYLDPALATAAFRRAS
jgi:hypothetical protein